MRINSTRLFRHLQGFAVGVALACGLGFNAYAAPTVPMREGSTTIKLDSAFATALTTAKVTLTALPRTQVKKTQASFPIIGGAIDLANAKGEISHAGGLALAVGGDKIEISNFVIDTFESKPVLTGIVVFNGSIVDRIPLFDLTLPSGVTLPLTVVDKRITLGDVGVKLNAGAAAQLNAALKVTTFTGGSAIGVATVKAKAACMGAGCDDDEDDDD